MAAGTKTLTALQKAELIFSVEASRKKIAVLVSQ